MRARILHNSPHNQQKSLNAVLGCNLKKRWNDHDLFPRQTIQYHSNPSLCPNHQCLRSWSWTVLWRPTTPSRTNTKKKKKVPFLSWGLECKSRKSRETWITRKFGLGVQNEAGWRLTELYQEKALVMANTLFQQHKRRLYTWTSPDGQYRNQTDYILCSQRWRSSI